MRGHWLNDYWPICAMTWRYGAKKKDLFINYIFFYLGHTIMKEGRKIMQLYYFRLLSLKYVFVFIHLLRHLFIFFFIFLINRWNGDLETNAVLSFDSSNATLCQIQEWTKHLQMFSLTPSQLSCFGYTKCWRALQKGGCLTRTLEPSSSSHRTLSLHTALSTSGWDFSP